jgi:hypothetical protein
VSASSGVSLGSRATLFRRRAFYAAGVVAVIALGLLWRSRWLDLPRFPAKYGGDALWALMVYLLVRSWQPRLSPWLGAGVALAISFAVEGSQLYHAPWIDGLRGTRLGALALGSTFNAPDLLAYTAGVACGLLIDVASLRQRQRSPR